MKRLTVFSHFICKAHKGLHELKPNLLGAAVGSAYETKITMREIKKDVIFLIDED